MTFSFLIFFGLDFLAGVNEEDLEIFRLGAGDEVLTGRRLPGPMLLLVLELLLVCGVVCIVVGGPDACFRLLLPWGGGVT